ncbi:MAG TPA: hypothetical protein VNT75_17435 [Symbiobacteriaceae bacterium]|nr:hypothetical protein [Symbiobacteriaceae bacterium]
MSLSNAARALPMIEREERPITRPAVKKAKKSAAGMVVISLGWLAVLVLSLFVVHRNTLVLAETNALTGKQETLAKLEQQIAEKSSRVNVSIDEIEKWAQAHSMKRPITVKAVAMDPNAVAPMAEPAHPVSVAAQAAPKSGGIYATVKGFFARFAEAKGAAIQGGN